MKFLKNNKWQIIQKHTFCYISKRTEITDKIPTSGKHIECEGSGKNALALYEHISGIILISLRSVGGQDNCLCCTQISVCSRENVIETYKDVNYSYL